MRKYQEIKDTVNDFIQAKKKLKELDVLRSERLTGEFGEWFAEKLTSAKRAKSTTQSGWDLIRDEEKFQVKTHAKSSSNKARWTEWKYTEKKFDFLVLLIFSQELRLREAYIIPYKIAEERINKKLKQIVLKWDDYPDYKISSFPKELSIFLAD